MNIQKAPFPNELMVVIEQLRYKKGWIFGLSNIDRGQGSLGLTLVITVRTHNSYTGEALTVAHYMPVPPAAYDKRSWQRWLFTQVLLVEQHEACEFFTVNEVKPYAPSHGPGNDPYLIREVGTEEDVRTSFRGELNKKKE